MFSDSCATDISCCFCGEPVRMKEGSLPENCLWCDEPFGDTDWTDSPLGSEEDGPVYSHDFRCKCEECGEDNG
jgi:hypothetical protein